VADKGIVVGGTLDAELAPSDKFYAVHLTEGKAQGGSSGSPLINSNRQIVGTLSAGPQFSPIPEEQDYLLCQEPELVIFYGRLTAGLDVLTPWLDDLRPAQMAFPRVGSTLPDGPVHFRWGSGVGALEYRLSIGRTVGGEEILSRSMGLATGYEVGDLPRDGRPIYVRLSTRLEDGWRHVDVTYIAHNGPATDAARITSPAPGSILTQSAMRFAWSTGSKVTAYRLEVGTTLGGAEVFVASGAATSADVQNIPLEGGTIYARLWSRIGGEWVKNDFLYRAADQRQRTVRVRITNHLVYPVAISVNGRSTASLTAGSTSTIDVPRDDSTVVSWRLIRPRRIDSGAQLGEELRGEFPVRAGTDPDVSFDINNMVGGVPYFAPSVTNRGVHPLLLEVNGVRLFYSVPIGETLPLGYYRWTAASEVRGYGDVLGYAGSKQIVPVTVDSIAAASGAATVTFQ
jgi:hypothetical protein